jgi:hypothetical protein
VEGFLLKKKSQEETKHDAGILGKKRPEEELHVGGQRRGFPRSGPGITYFESGRGDTAG